jgi:ubiquinone/menaquinone biosynthesis C-methylase UbiE
MTPDLSSRRSFDEQTVARARLLPGEVVLDVCSAAGIAALAAARAVDPKGRVIGLETDPALIEEARSRAAAESIGNVEFRQAHFDQVYFRGASFDAIVCCFGVSQFSSPQATVQKMWRFLRPGGRLVISAWESESIQTVLPEAAIEREGGVLYAVAVKNP